MSNEKPLVCYFLCIDMANPDEALVEFSSMTEEECQIAVDNKPAIKERGATAVFVKRRDGHPNRIEVWGPTQEAVDRAAEFFIDLCGN